MMDVQLPRIFGLPNAITLPLPTTASSYYETRLASFSSGVLFVGAVALHSGPPAVAIIEQGAEVRLLNAEDLRTCLQSSGPLALTREQTQLFLSEDQEDSDLPDDRDRAWSVTQLAAVFDRIARQVPEEDNGEDSDSQPDAPFTMLDAPEI